MRWKRNRSMSRKARQQRDTADREIDLHGLPAVQTRAKLERHWSSREWHGLQRIRVIHGTGDVLHAVVRLWCEEKGVEWTTESYNPGVTVILPGRRLQTPAAPPHRPLNGLKRHLPKNPAARRPAPPEPSLSDKELFARELDRLSGVETQNLQRDKRSPDPGPCQPPAPTIPQIENRQSKIENPIAP